MTSPTSSTTIPALVAVSDTFAADIAADIEGLRRQITLSGALLLIPSTMLLTLIVAAAVGVAGVWLALCALVGLSVGPAVCLCAMVLSHVVGRPVAYRLFRRRCTRLRLTARQARSAWEQALSRLDEEERAAHVR